MKYRIGMLMTAMLLFVGLLPTASSFAQAQGHADKMSDAKVTGDKMADDEMAGDKTAPKTHKKATKASSKKGKKAAADKTSHHWEMNDNSRMTDQD